jgi:hypothetical protein
MAITNAQQIDLLWKKVVFGVTETNVTGKFPSNETIASPLPVYNSNIWAQTDATSIPSAPPSANSSTVAVYTVSAGNVIAATADPTAAVGTNGAQTWLATATYGTPSTRVGDWIPPTFNPLYVVQVYIGNPNTKAARILPDTAGEEWVFDYNAGVLYFPNGAPASKSATIGSGSCTVGTDGIYFVGYRYIGIKGFSAAGTTSKVNVVATIAARNALSGVNAGDVAFVTDATADAVNVAPGQYATYLWNGSAWQLISTQASAKSDAASDPTTITYNSNAATALGYVSGGNRVASVTVTVTTAFNGNCALSAGDASNHSNIISNTVVDLTLAGAVFTAQPTYIYPANTQTDMFVYLTTDNTATQGSATVIVTFA